MLRDLNCVDPIVGENGPSINILTLGAELVEIADQFRHAEFPITSRS
jgi:hypothetical protein